jgi:hypothetical protein
MGHIPEPPEVLAAALGTRETPPVAHGCVDCAVEGTSSGPLTAVFTVSGTILCKTHAVLARTLETVK